MTRVDKILARLGIDLSSEFLSHEGRNLMDYEAQELQLAIGIDNHLKLKQIMQIIDDLKAKVDTLQGQVAINNALLAKLNGAVKDALAKAATGGLSDADQAELKAISDEVDQINTSVAAADTANDPDAAPAAQPAA